MKLSIVLVLILNVLGTHSHCNILCQLWNVVSGDSDDTSKEVVDNCDCVRTNKCYQEDISTQVNCIDTVYKYIDTNYVCCRRPVRITIVRLSWNPTKRPSQRPQPTTRIPSTQPTTKVPSLTSTQIPITNPPTQIRPPSPQPQPQDTSQVSPTNTHCTCMPLSDCYGEDFESTNQHKQGSCTNPNHACCLGLVQPVTTPQPQRPKPTPIPTQVQSLVSSPRPQSSSPSPISLSIDQNCTCTPFYKCYDEETSSNLTGVVNDRVAIPIIEEGCSAPNDVCCHNLVRITAKPTIESSFKDCTGSCISIKDCPYLLSKLNEAQDGNLDAVQELRRSVCSNTNGNLHVCCPSNDCQFPFIYKDVTYSECTSIDDPEGKFWCSTQTDKQSNHVKDQWEHCTSDDAMVAAAA